ncbi:MAG TPA: UDP-glucose/GDP-mannose dehydrogenase family protein [Candidatus Hydrogenedentes bacterium]|jgi:UDPglucose 6-dehydrogenase|nr:UDP-glucose/GDP-mannose dehydrogenase family protein [Candidatus Hydrogenedentota bacterium]HPJ98313.1 UDP-glucose/GDP-mannose dehydrogenase family protein [Candidatus Hydrogenedentota bacterium]
MRISVIGTGYVGLVAGTCLADTGHRVICVDIDKDRVGRLKRGEMPIYEPGLEELLTRNIEEERLSFTCDLREAVSQSLLVFLCVGTPLLESGEHDLSALIDAAEQVARVMDGYRIIVNKSTGPAGTTARLADRMRELTSHEFDVVANPEFIKEGAAVDDFLRPDRIVVGCKDIRVLEIMRELYAPFLRTGKPFLSMDLASAEMSKLAVNAMLAARISVMNEFAIFCEAAGADVSHVREAVAADGRIGAGYLFPGLGFGGSCLPKDVIASAAWAKSMGLDASMLQAAAAVNNTASRRFIERILSFYGDTVAQKQIAVWGATFKPRTDDLRGAPALRVIDALLDAGMAIHAYDPVAGKQLAALYGDRIRVAAKNYDALAGADGLVICTEWNEFRRPDYDRMAGLMRERVIFDGRNLYTPATLKQNGFQYFSVGRG